MITVEHVGEAVVGAIEKGRHRQRYPIGDVNMDWKAMLKLMFQAMGLKRKIYYIPPIYATLFGKNEKKKNTKNGLESGLDHELLFKNIEAQYTYFDPTDVNKELGYGWGGIEESIRKTIEACYPKLK
jgi:hypothetical protein